MRIIIDIALPDDIDPLDESLAITNALHQVTRDMGDRGQTSTIVYDDDGWAYAHARTEGY